MSAEVGQRSVGAGLRYDGQVAIVTGGGRGLGRSYALHLAARGARVVVNDLGGAVSGDGADASVAQGVVDEVTADGGIAVASAASVSTPAGGEQIVATALERFGRVDIVVCSVGILRPADFGEATLEDLNAEHAIHVGGTFNVCRAAWSQLTGQRYGRIVTTGSGAFLGVPYLAPYGTAKAGVFGLTRSMALSGYDDGIRVNQVNPISDSTRMSNFRFAHRQAANGAPSSERTRSEFRTAPAQVAPLVGVLAHRDCPTTGEMYGAVGGHVHRFFVGETRGYDIRDLSAEDLLDSWERVMDEAGYAGTPMGQGRSTPDRPSPEPLPPTESSR